jgi:hypothetical protein
MELNEVCSRCGKSVPLQATAEQMIAKIAEENAVKENIQKICDFVSTLEGPLPDAVTLLLDGSSLRVEALAKLCGPNDNNKRNKSGCAQRVKMLFDDVHRRAKTKDED